MIKTFISFDNLHEDKKNEVKRLIDSYDQFEDISVDFEIDLSTNEAVRQEIRDNYITDATVLVLLATTDVKGRKFIDWELAAAMYDGSKRVDGKRNDICGIVVVDYVGNNVHTHYDEVKNVHSKTESSPVKWIHIDDAEKRRRFPHLPQRILDSMIKGAEIQVIPSHKIKAVLPMAIWAAHVNKENNKGKYVFNDLKKNNSPRKDSRRFSGIY